MPAQSSAPAVIVSPVTEQLLADHREHIGRIEAVASVALRARVEGILVDQSFQAAREVSKGDLLFSIERAPYELTVQQREADFASVNAQLKLANADYNRRKDLQKRGAVSAAQIDESLANLEVARANVLLAKAALEQAKLNLSYTAIHSPIDGRASRARYSVGNLVNSSSDPLVTITSIDPVYVTIGVSERLLLNARRAGFNFENPSVFPKILLSDGQPYPEAGVFDYLSPQVDTKTDTLAARAIFPNPIGVLVPGQIVKVIVTDKKSETVQLVPQASVQEDRKGFFVLVVEKDKTVAVRRVEIGQQLGIDWVIKSGLKTGEMVIVQGLQKVQPGMAVNPIRDNEPMDESR
jgi:membrane fusion protein (multidrug efflux system)